MKISKLILLLPVVIALSGCSKTIHMKYSYITANSAPVNAVDRNAQSQLAETSASTSKSLQQLSAMQMAVHPKAKLAAPLNPKRLGMTQITSLNWNGPIEPLLRKIADASHYKLHVLGTKPAIAVLVSIDAHNQTLAEILRNATYQVEKKAAVKVYPGRHIIELRYYRS